MGYFQPSQKRVGENPKARLVTGHFWVQSVYSADELPVLVEYVAALIVVGETEDQAAVKITIRVVIMKHE